MSTLLKKQKKTRLGSLLLKLGETSFLHLGIFLNDRKQKLKSTMPYTLLEKILIFFLGITIHFSSGVLLKRHKREAIEYNGPPVTSGTLTLVLGVTSLIAFFSLFE